MTDAEKGARQMPSGPRWARARSKPRSLTGAMKTLLGLMRPDIRVLIAGTACLLLSTLISIIGPRILETVTDEISRSILDSLPLDTAGIGAMLTVLGLMYAAAFALSYSGWYSVSLASQRLGDRLRKDLSRKFHRLPLSYLEAHSIGDTMSRVSNDTDTIRRDSAESVANTINSLIMLIGSLSMMLLICWQLCIVAILPTVCGMLAIYVVTRRTQPLFSQQTADLGRLNAIVDEAYYGHDIVRTYNGWDQVGRGFDEVNRRLFRTSYLAKIATMSVPQIMDLISNMGYVTVCVAGAAMIVNGDISYGTIAAFIIYIKMFNQPVAMMSNIIARMQSVASSIERITDFLSLPEMDATQSGRSSFRAVGKVEFRKVRFGYTPDAEIIHGLDLVVEPGSTIAIVGPTGAGKTTIVNLLMRFYEPDSGEILIDGVPISSLSREQVREQFSMVLQDTFIFDGTVYDNVACTSSGATREKVEAACAVVGIDDYIRTLENGYDTVLDGRCALSVGQRQQIAIARAMVKDAPMVILDEATSSVDTRTEKRIQKAMDSVTSGRTSFVIAHRLSTVRNATRILVMVGGEIIESGTHEELMELNGYYRMLHDAQFEERSAHSATRLLIPSMSSTP